MSEKLPPLEVLQKLAAEKGVELPDDILDEVAGGYYTMEEWNSMTPEERQAAQRRSIRARRINQPCELD